MKIIERNVNNQVDYILEEGIELYLEDWNGEIYTNGFDKNSQKNTNKCYRPVYKFEIENIDISEIEENSEEWFDLNEIVEFDEY